MKRKIIGALMLAPFVLCAFVALMYGLFVIAVTHGPLIAVLAILVFVLAVLGLAVIEKVI